MKSRTTVSFALIFTLLVAALVVFWPAIRNVPSLTGLLSDTPVVRSAPAKSRVWVNRRSGLFYCRDASAYGKLPPGAFMDQRQATEEGYSPAPASACKDDAGSYPGQTILRDLGD